MAEVLKPDICVIGAGSGGLTVAAAAAAFGVPVVLIEKGKFGGECLNTGCVPSKALIAAAERAAALPAGEPFGVRAPRASVLFSGAHDHVQQVVAAVAPNDSRERMIGLGVRVIEGTARFTDERTVAAGDFEIKARRFVIATGSQPSVPAIHGLADIGYLTNESVFGLTVCPKHLIVIGAGPVGLELAQAFRRLGAAVTVLEAATPLANDDTECAAVVLDALKRDGVVLRTGVTIGSARRARARLQVVLAGPDGEETIEGTHILVAAGRAPNVEDLDLAAAGIAYEPRGITVDKSLRTTNPHVYAIGDAAGALQFTHVASYHAGLVIRNALFRLPVKVNHDIVPWVTYTDPQLAHVGLTEAEARKRDRKFRILRWPYHENDRAQTERATEGHIKVLTDPWGRILGVTVVGAQASEIIATWALAISQRLNIRTMAGLVFAYPTFGEVGKRAAITYFTPSLTNTWVRRIIGWLRRLG
jgi:pyruvate/2-oxoglutarate dehydrogenase complex dihydrolipoamide dehydrogenase (E3) component